MSFDVTIEGLEDLRRDWDESLGVLSDGIRRGVDLGVKEGADYARSNHAYKDKTGALTRSISGRLETSTRGGAVGVIEATAPYASEVEKGTAPHEIRPKASSGFVGPVRRGQSRRASDDIGTTRTALRFDMGGEQVFARVVHHPGTAPHPFIGPAAQKAERVILREVEVSQERVAEIMSR